MTDPSPLVLVLSGSTWFLGREGVYPTLLDPCEYHGLVQQRATDNGMTELRIVRVVQPVEALSSVRAIQVAGPRIELVDLSAEDRQDITRRYEACLGMMQSMRAQQAGIAPPLLLLPGGLR